MGARECQVRGCGNSNRGGAATVLFKFPSDSEEIRFWERFCERRAHTDPKSRFICIKHFRKADLRGKE